MKSKITSKYQVTIPKKIREALKLRATDSIEWIIEDKGVQVEPVSKPFLKYRGFIKPEVGSIKKDIEKAIKKRMAKYK